MQKTKEKGRVYYLKTNLPSCLQATPMVSEEKNIERKHGK
jgi:hypothetical protein